MTNNEYIYLRLYVKEQCAFLKNTVVDDSNIGWIVGPPGTGKSTTSFLFAMQLDRSQWVITWLSLSRICQPVATCFVNDKKQTLWFNGIMADLICQFISQIQSHVNTVNKNHIVFIDGVTQTPDHLSLCQSLVTWIISTKATNTNCRLVFVGSVASRRKSKVHEDNLYCIKQFFVCSWTIDEYRLAFKNKDFCQSVLKYFDCSQKNDLSNKELNSRNLSNEELEELIVSKHYFAGGSSRFMFGMNTADVVLQLERGMENLNDVRRYLNHEVGYNVNCFTHTFFGFYISEYLASALAAKGGESYIQDILFAIGHNNPVLQGWLLEIYFFAAIKSNGFQYNERHVSEVKLFRGTIFLFDPLSMQSIPEGPEGPGPVWLKPSKWNQGGYDAVYVDKDNGIVIIVQVTRSGTHKFTIEYFAQLLEILSGLMDIKAVEICFVVSPDVLENFKISTVSGQGLLRKYPGWQSIENEEDNVKVLVALGVIMPGANNTSTKGKGIIITANALHQVLAICSGLVIL